MSSQVSCLNHLFSIRDDKDAVIAIVKHMYPEIVDVFKISTDHYAPAYIQFESVSDVDHLNEGKPNIGRNCTSIDALIYGVSKNGRKILILIEWENAETYSNVDKAIGVSGIERKKRYSDLINNSSQLIANSHYVYYFEPFYQLMRQTLWSEQMISNKVSETVKADDFIYIHVIPSGNLTLLNKTYPCSGQDMEATWRSCLKDQSKYIIGSPKDLLSQVNWGKYPDLRKYLDARYW